MDDLRRLTVRVLLAVLVVTVVGEFIDAWVFGDKFDGAIPLITLVGGMVSGLFAPELLRTRRGQVEEPPKQPPEKEAASAELPVPTGDRK